MMNVIFSMLVFAFSFIGHVANVPVHVEKRTKDIHENVVTIISKLSTKEKLDIYNIGIKDIEALPDVLKTGARDSIKFHIERPSFLYIGTAIMTPLYVKPGDRIIVENDTSGNIYFRNVRYPQRSAELNFFFTLNKYLKKIRRKNVVPEIKTEEKILDSIQNTQHLSHGFVQEARYWITYRSLKFSYLASLRSKGPAGNLKPFPQNDSCINLLPYRGALYNYIMLLMRKGNSGKFDFKFLDEIAKNNFTGDTKKCALFMFLNFKMNTGLTDSGYVAAFNEFLHSYPEYSLTTYLKNSYNQKIAINNSFEKDVNKELLVNKEHKLIAFSDILEKYKGKVIVLDFWARYCGPCLAELPYSKKLENELSHDDVVFIYLSTDHEYDKWLEKIKDLGIGNKNNTSYLLNLPEKSGLLKYFQVETIPRYVIIGKKGKIISRDAPRPSEPALLQLIKENL